MSTFISFTNLDRLIVTKAAQCGAWNAWCTQHKKARNARISHSENPAKSDAVNFFLHLLSTEPYAQFDFKQTLYTHFQRMLSTPDKALLHTDANFAAKVNPSRKYPVCDVDMANLFNEDGDPIFVMELNSPEPSSAPTTSKTKKGTKANTGLKRTLCTSVPKKKRSGKQAAAAQEEPDVQLATPVTTPSVPLPEALPENQVAVLSPTT